MEEGEYGLQWVVTIDTRQYESDLGVTNFNKKFNGCKHLHITLKCIYKS